MTIPILFPIVLLACALLVYISYPDLQDGLLTGSVVFIPIAVYAVLEAALHVNYYLANKKDVLTVGRSDNQITFSHGAKKTSFNVTNISSIVYHKPLLKHMYTERAYDFSRYYHLIITLNDKTQIIITSLMVGTDFTLPVPLDKVQVKRNIYRWVQEPSLKVATDL